MMYKSRFNNNFKFNDISNDDCSWEIVDKIPFKGDNRNSHSAESFSFIFIDGTLSEPYTVKSENFVFSLTRCGIGAGFERGKSRRKILNFVNIQVKDNSETNLIKFILDSISKEFSSENLGEVIYVTGEDEILIKLRQEELKLAVELATEKNENRETSDENKIPAIVLDGSIPADKKLYESLIRICGLVKNVRCWYGYSDECLKKFCKGETSDILKLEKNGITKFAFFIKMSNNNLTTGGDIPVIRAEFSLCEDPENFANIFKHKILRWSSSIGDRAPKNLTPIRVLERIIRSHGGSEEFILRKIQVIVKKFGIQHI